MGCGCKAKQAKKENQNIQLEISDPSPILLDESLISHIGKNTSIQSNNFPFCKLSSNEYNSENVNIKIHNADGSLIHDVSISKYESLEKIVKIILDFEKSSHIRFHNKEGIASEIASHTYVHKVVKQCIDDYSQNKISLQVFQDRIQSASHLSYNNSQELVAEFEKAKKLLH
jgi:hypothetical protein